MTSLDAASPLSILGEFIETHGSALALISFITLSAVKVELSASIKGIQDFGSVFQSYFHILSFLVMIIFLGGDVDLHISLLMAAISFLGTYVLANLKKISREIFQVTIQNIGETRIRGCMNFIIFSPLVVKRYFHFVDIKRYFHFVDIKKYFHFVSIKKCFHLMNIPVLLAYLCLIVTRPSLMGHMYLSTAFVLYSTWIFGIEYSAVQVALIFEIYYMLNELQTNYYDGKLNRLFDSPMKKAWMLMKEPKFIIDFLAKLSKVWFLSFHSLTLLPLAFLVTRGIASIYHEPSRTIFIKPFKEHSGASYFYLFMIYFGLYDSKVLTFDEESSDLGLTMTDTVKEAAEVVEDVKECVKEGVDMAFHELKAFSDGVVARMSPVLAHAGTPEPEKQESVISVGHGGTSEFGKPPDGERVESSGVATDGLVVCSTVAGLLVLMM